MRTPSTSLLVIAGVLGAGCWMMVPRESTTFAFPSDSLLRETDTIALVPVRVPDDLDISEAVLITYDSLVESTLRQSGFAVVPAAEYSKIWNRLTREAGGFFDPFTGRRDEPKFDAAVRRLYWELNAGFGPDALLFPEIEVVEVEFYGRVAEWDGIQQGVVGPFDRSGWALAVSLVVVLERVDGTELYTNLRGIEIIEGPDGVAITPPPFTSPERPVEVVRAVLQPLIDRRPPPADSLANPPSIKRNSQRD